MSPCSPPSGLVPCLYYGASSCKFRNCRFNHEGPSLASLADQVNFLNSEVASLHAFISSHASCSPVQGSGNYLQCDTFTQTDVVNGFQANDGSQCDIFTQTEVGNSYQDNDSGGYCEDSLSTHFSAPASVTPPSPRRSKRVRRPSKKMANVITQIDGMNDLSLPLQVSQISHATQTTQPSSTSQTTQTFHTSMSSCPTPKLPSPAHHPGLARSGLLLKHLPESADSDVMFKPQ